jgi:formylglycine-generating enzyme required for sulfatase activity
MPQRAQLPESLQNFAFLNAAPVDTGRDFHQHIERLIRGIDQMLPDQRATSPATTGSRDEVAAPAQPASNARPAEAARRADEETRRVSTARNADADMPDFAVFRDAPFTPDLVMLPAGEFMMGSPDGEEGGDEEERPQHRVTIGQLFALGRFPVTFAEYDRFCEAKRREKPGDEGWGRGRRPVINVRWEDARAYMAWLSQETGRAYRLPSEAEWEYACRAGTTTRYSFGDAITPRDANYYDSGLGLTSEVGTYPSNHWGLHDMHGNVWEWVEDDWHENYRGAPTDGSAWKGPGSSSSPRLCVLRGGSWSGDSRLCRSAFRYGYRTVARNGSVGFRVARTLS